MLLENLQDGSEKKNEKSVKTSLFVIFWHLEARVMYKNE